MLISPKAKYILEKTAGPLPYLLAGGAGLALGALVEPKLKENYDYGKYVAKHKFNVISPMRQMGLGYGQALKHDLSKLTPSEFGPYRNWFAGPKGITGTRDPETYRKWRGAVEHHYHAPGNLHHYRALGLKQSVVPLKYRMEAVADWYSVQKTKGSTNEQFPDWYKRVRDKLPIIPETKSAINERLGFNKEALAKEINNIIKKVKVVKNRAEDKAIDIVSGFIDKRPKLVKGIQKVMKSKPYREISEINSWGKTMHGGTRKAAKIIGAISPPGSGGMEIAGAIHGGLSAMTYYTSKAIIKSPKARAAMEFINNLPK